MKDKEAVTMRIDAYNQISQVYGASGKMKTQATAKTGSTDKVEISNFGKELQVAKQAVASAPDIRTDKAEQLKEQMVNGSYNVSIEELTEKFLAGF